MYKIVISPSALRCLERLRKINKDMSDRIIRAIDELQKEPFKGKKLLGELADFRSLRVSEYRIVYAVIQQKVLIQVVKISHRREIYR